MLFFCKFSMVHGAIDLRLAGITLHRTCSVSSAQVVVAFSVVVVRDVPRVRLLESDLATERDRIAAHADKCGVQEVVR